MTINITTDIVVTALDLGRYDINQLYNMLQLGLLTRAEYLSELDRRTDDEGNIHL